MLIAAGALVTIVAPAVSPALAQLARQRALLWYARDFQPQDVRGAQLVMLTEIDPVLGGQLRALAQAGRFWLCAIDQPALSDVFLVSTVRAGPVLISISTGGLAPLLARRIRTALESALDARFGEFARKFAALRAKLRKMPRAERSRALERALAGFAMEVRVRYPDEDGQGAGDQRK